MFLFHFISQKLSSAVACFTFCSYICLFFKSVQNTALRWIKINSNYFLIIFLLLQFYLVSWIYKVNRYAVMSPGDMINIQANMGTEIRQCMGTITSLAMRMFESNTDVQLDGEPPTGILVGTTIALPCPTLIACQKH